METFEERYRYLKLGGQVGVSTFGFDRWLNQQFYRSPEWISARSEVIIRDNGCDLGIEGYEIASGLLVHHMNPVIVEDFTEGNRDIYSLDYLITTSLRTHNAIHYGDESLLPRKPIMRKPGDTRLW